MTVQQKLLKIGVSIAIWLCNRLSKLFVDIFVGSRDISAEKTRIFTFLSCFGGGFWLLDVSRPKFSNVDQSTPGTIAKYTDIYSMLHQPTEYWVVKHDTFRHSPA